MAEPGIHVLQLRSDLVRLASVAPPPDTEIVGFFIHYTRDSVHALLSALGADADAYLAAIDPSEFLTKRELEPVTCGTSRFYSEQNQQVDGAQRATRARRDPGLRPRAYSHR